MMSLCHAPIRQESGNPVRKNFQQQKNIKYTFCKYDSKHESGLDVEVNIKGVYAHPCMCVCVRHQPDCEFTEVTELSFIRDLQ